MQNIGISYILRKLARSTVRRYSAADYSAAVIKRGGLRQKGRAQPASGARRFAAVDWRPCRHYSAAECSTAVVQCGGVRQNSRAEPASRARRTAAVEWRAGRLNSAADCGSTVAF